MSWLFDFEIERFVSFTKVCFYSFDNLNLKLTLSTGGIYRGIKLNAYSNRKQVILQKYQDSSSKIMVEEARVLEYSCSIPV
jgi:hypothetical protein